MAAWSLATSTGAGPNVAGRAKKRPRSTGSAAAADQHIDVLTVLIDRTVGTPSGRRP
jgi:hypothetical protein